MRLTRQLFSTYRPPPQIRYGTVTSVSTGICTVQVAGGEIPVVTINGAPVNVGDFVMVQRQGQVSYLGAVPSGALWATDSDLGIWRITTSGQFTRFNPPSGVIATKYLANGPDKRMWARSLIGVSAFTQGGQPTFYPLNNANASAFGLAWDAYGYLWIVDQGQAVQPYMWRMAPDGTYTTLGPFPSPAVFELVATTPSGETWVTDVGASPGVWWGAANLNFATDAVKIPLAAAVNDLVYGPDGNMWASDYLSPSLFVMNTGGLISTFPVPSICGALCNGPGQYVWAASNGYNELYRVDPAGNVTPFTLTNGPYNTYALALCVGPDKNLWGIYQSGETPGYQLGKFAPSGTLTLYQFPTVTPTAAPFQIAAGP